MKERNYEITLKFFRVRKKDYIDENNTDHISSELEMIFMDLIRIRVKNVLGDVE